MVLNEGWQPYHFYLREIETSLSELHDIYLQEFTSNSCNFGGENFLDLSQVKTLKYTGSWRPMTSSQKILKEKSFLPSFSSFKKV